jgi:SAM-dependent methyltransferase
MLEEKQKIQEEEYFLPYHWFKEPGTYGGRLYFGYLSLCLDFLRNFSKDQLSQINVLDAGCGDGRFLKELQNIGVRNIYGVDYSERALSFARLLIPEAKLSKADLTEGLPYKEEYFDFIFMIETLEHIIPDRINMLLINLKKVLKRDGNLIITVPSINAFLPEHGKHYQHFSVDLLKKYIEPVFKIEKIIGQDKIGFHILKLIYKLLDNRYWLIKPLAEFYNLKIWPKFFNKCNLEEAGRLIVKCQNR